MYIEHYTDKNAIEQLTDINVILQSWEMFYAHFNCRPDEKEFPIYYQGYIIDEDKSIKWNRKEVERRMTARAEEGKRLRALYSELNSSYEKTLLKALAKEYEISTKEASIIWTKAYTDNHSYGMSSVCNRFDELADMYEELREVRKE